MNRSTIIGIIAIPLIIAGLIALSRLQSTPSDTPGSLAVVGESAYSFGSISMQDGKVSRDFIIENTGENPVRIISMYTSCMCTEALLAVGSRRAGPFGMPGHTPLPPVNVDLEPGERGTVSVVFDPAAHGPAGVGTIARTVTIESDAGAVTLSFNATVMP